jgi:hypothetical protein
MRCCIPDADALNPFSMFHNVPPYFQFSASIGKPDIFPQHLYHTNQITPKVRQKMEQGEMCVYTSSMKDRVVYENTLYAAVNRVSGTLWILSAIAFSVLLTILVLLKMGFAESLTYSWVYLIMLLYGVMCFAGSTFHTIPQWIKKEGNILIFHFHVNVLSLKSIKETWLDIRAIEKVKFFEPEGKFGGYPKVFVYLQGQKALRVTVDMALYKMLRKLQFPACSASATCTKPESWAGKAGLEIAGALFGLISAMYFVLSASVETKNLEYFSFVVAGIFIYFIATLFAILSQKYGGIEVVSSSTLLVFSVVLCGTLNLTFFLLCPPNLLLSLLAWVLWGASCMIAIYYYRRDKSNV